MHSFAALVMEQAVNSRAIFQDKTFRALISVKQALQMAHLPEPQLHPNPNVYIDLQKE